MGLILSITKDDIEWAEEAVENARKLFPRFCSHGIQPYEYHDPLVFEDEYLEGVVICKYWLKHFKAAASINRSYSSYGCKHFVEHWAGQYVCNGAFIAAAAGTSIKQAPVYGGSPNTFLAIKYSSWKGGSGWETRYEGLQLQGVVKELNL